jgi:hypothetical protein
VAGKGRGGLKFLSDLTEPNINSGLNRFCVGLNFSRPEKFVFRACFGSTERGLSNIKVGHVGLAQEEHFTGGTTAADSR